MIVLRNKEFSTAGKLWAGTKGALKSGAKGTLWGTGLGGALGLTTKDKKMFLISSAAGAGIGATIGAINGWKSGVDKYKYDNDPEYRKRVDAEYKELVEKEIVVHKKEDHRFSNEFTYASWKSLQKKIDVPESFLKYVKFYEAEWKKNIDLWYGSYNYANIDMPYKIIDFKEVFPIPINSKISERWFNYDNDDLVLATVNDAGDDGFLVYNVANKTFGWDVSGPKDSKSLKEILMKQCNLSDTENSYLSKEQIELINKFKNKVRSL